MVAGRRFCDGMADVGDGGDGVLGKLVAIHFECIATIVELL